MVGTGALESLGPGPAPRVSVAGSVAAARAPAPPPEFDFQLQAAKAKALKSCLDGASSSNPSQPPAAAAAQVGTATQQGPGGGAGGGSAAFVKFAASALYDRLLRGLLLMFCARLMREALARAAERARALHQEGECKGGPGAPWHAGPLHALNLQLRAVCVHRNTQTHT